MHKRLKPLIAVGVPTFNEADVIANTIRKIDDGLSSAYGASRCVIVNADNQSADGTAEVFRRIETRCQKVHLASRNNGKGSNVFAFLEWFAQEKMSCGAIIDADIRTIESNWAAKLIDPVISGSSDFVFPLYLRSRFEGNTTNHFAMPFVYTFFGTFIRQPIGGEFGFSANACRHFLKQERPSEAYGYGIDMFLTVNALGLGRSRVCQRLLGRKFHKPSFPKIVRIFREEFSAAIHSIRNYGLQFGLVEQQNIGDEIAIDEDGDFSHKWDLGELQEQMASVFNSSRSEYVFRFGHSFVDRLTPDYRIGESEWAEIISLFIAEAFQKGNASECAELLSPLFIFRTITYLRECEKLSALEVENRLRDQAEKIKDRTLSRLSL